MAAVRNVISFDDRRAAACKPEILRKRYAKGEIGREEFKTISRDIEK
jgi:uncharacterized membrane protein